jgi:ABC-type multidrug transport system ATPase subunit
VLVNGIDVYRNFDAIRNEIGYVPQRDIIHMELTVYQALDYAARLRMPRDTSKAERHKRITEVLEDLDLVHRKDVQISGLSGGQQKRVSIGVELLTRPGLFFLDEPTSGLDPGTETAFMHLMRRLADQGRTIVMVTHATKNVMLADKVVFLARGGYLAWFGPPDEALAYFDQYRTERERRSLRWSSTRYMPSWTIRARATPRNGLSVSRSTRLSKSISSSRCSLARACCHWSSQRRQAHRPANGLVPGAPAKR